MDDVLELRELTALADELADLALPGGMGTFVLRPARLSAYRDAVARFVETRDEAEWLREEDREPLARLRGLLVTPRGALRRGDARRAVAGAASLLTRGPVARRASTHHSAVGASVAEAHEPPESTARSVAERVPNSQQPSKTARKRVLGCDRQSDHEVDCEVVISNIHDQVDKDIFGPNYRQKCWTTVVVTYVRSTRRQVGYRTTGWDRDSYAV